MRNLFVSLILVTLAPWTMAFAGKGKAMKAEGFKLIKVAELSKWMEKEAATVHIFDANGDDTRKADGMIPGAIALASSSSYDVSVLPQSKTDKLVFYCANTQCMASHAAAKRASEAGYSAVFVMSDGIEGWKKAGKKTVPPT